MDDQNKNLLFATALSFLVILVWFIVGPIVAPQWFPEQTPAVSEQAQAPAAAEPPAPGVAPLAPADPAEQRADALASAPRVTLETPRLSGSISMTGGRIDDLSLKDYRVSLDEDAPNVTLLSPVGTPGSLYALFGWSPADTGLSADQVPGPNTVWTQTGGTTLGVGAPVTLAWTADNGLTFERTISIDEDYMFTVTDKVVNAGTAPVALYPYGVVERKGLPDTLRNFFILHEGVVQMADGTLTEITFDDMEDLDVVAAEGGPAEVTQVSQNGWIGFTDHYWQAVLVPAAGEPFTAVAKHLPDWDIYRTSYRMTARTLAPGATTEVSARLFAGAKEWETIRNYQNEAGVDRFIDSIDWGWFFFLTKPIFAVLHWLNAQIGNMGVAIICLTLILKALLFPLARKSYISMARMKELQPEMEKLKERVGDDRQKMQREMMELYKREKVNPAAGCLPILLQIPIFFSLYKVIFVTLELRHAPFFGWIKDLSAPDPTSLYNLYGLLPWAAPEPGSILALIFIGVLPLLLGISMWFQQKLNPAPTDPTQAAVFAWMPWIFMFMLGSFASGLIIYWICNNTITFFQQYFIMRMHGHKPDLFGNIKSSFTRKQAPAAANKPAKPGKK